ncbi:CAPNN [Mytilus edulis]|uniref:CAPNN n=1 Tax=Mytilus edulis TaxID=6550 RepID=A0A8S3T9R6_MYTED|nr:CAPNN [Mytilus edulis]
MVRCRNPWGNESEWKGAFSDESERWKYITDSDKEEIGLTQEDDGEFWMTFGDWQSNFQKLEICNLGPDSLDDDELVKIGKKRWEATSEVGEWIPNVNAGGCRNYLQTFFTNPQYRVTVTDPDEDEDDLCTILVGVLQKDRRKKRKEGLDMLTIGYVIYKLKDPDCGPLDVDFFKYNASVAKSPSFINLREVCGRHMLQPGTYCIIPSTFEPHNKGEYLLRIFTEKANVTHEIDEETAIQEDQEQYRPSQRRTGVFKEFDKDSSGRLSSYELRSALHASGFKLSNRTFSTLVMRFSNKAGEIEFSDFMLCAIKLKTMLGATNVAVTADPSRP